MDDVIRINRFGNEFRVESTTWFLFWNKVNECISTVLFIKTCTLYGCKCVWVVGILCLSIVLFELLSYSLISCVHHGELVGGVFYNLLLTSVKACLETIWVMRPLLRNCHYAQCIKSKFSCNRSLIFSHKTLVLSNRRPIYFCHSRDIDLYDKKRKRWFFFLNLSFKQ